MLIRWLLKTFPAEMTRGWNLVRCDLWLWICVSSLLALLSELQEAGKASPRLALLLAACVTILTVALLAMRFQSAAGGASSGLADIAGRAVRRAPLLFCNLTVAVLLSAAGGAAIRIPILLLWKEQPWAPPLALAAGAIIYLSLLTRFCFIPFLGVLDERARAAPAGRLWAPLDPLLWPLRESLRLTAGLRPRLLPYLAMVALGPAATAALAAPWRLPAAVLWQLLLFTAQAVLFLFYRQRRAADLG